MELKAITIATIIAATLALTTQTVYASVSQEYLDGAYAEGHADGYNDYLDGFAVTSKACDSYDEDGDAWCDAYINGYEDGVQDALQGE